MTDSDAGRGDGGGGEQRRVQKPDTEPDSKRDVARDLLVAYRVPVTLFTLAGALYALHIGLLPSTVDIPPKWTRYAVQFTIASAIAYLPAERAAQWLDEDTRIALHEVDPADGDYAVILLPDERWENLTVLDKQGNEVDKSKLFEVMTKTGRQSYECQWYDIESNTAVVSFMAGFSPTEVRRYRKSQARIEEEVAAKSAKYDDVTANLRLVVRDAASSEINQFIHAYDGLMQLDDTSMKDNLEAARERYGVSQAELESVVEDDVDVDDPRVKHGDKELAGSDETAYSYDNTGGDAASGSGGDSA